MTDLSHLRQFIATAVGVALVAAVISWSAIGTAIDRRIGAFTDLESNLAAQAKIAAQAMDGTLRMIDTTLSNIGESVTNRSLSDNYSPRYFHDSIKRTLASLPQVSRLIVYDETGRAESDTNSHPARLPDIAESDLFLSHRDRLIDFVITSPGHRLAPFDSRTMLVSRRIDNLDGSMRGVVMAVIPASTIIDAFAVVSEESPVAIVLLDQARSIIAAMDGFHGPVSEPGSEFAKVSWLGSIANAVFDAPGTHAGVTGARYRYTVRRLPQFPLRVLVAQDEATVTARWRSESLVPALFVTATTWVMALLVFAFLAWQGRRSLLDMQALRNRDANSSRMLEALGESGFGLFVVDRGYNIRYMNRPLIAMFGDHTAEKRHQGLSRQTEILGFCRLEDVIDRGQTVHYQHSTPDGRIFDVTAVPITNDDATVSKLEIVQEITERVAAQREREKMLAALSRSNDEMTRLTEVMAHHFQEPARRLVTFAQRLHRTAPALTNDPDSRISLDFIESEARRLKLLVNDIQLYLAANMPRGPMGPTDANDIVAEEVQRLAPRLDEEAGDRIEVGDLPPAPLDEPRLRELFHVLMDNAVSHARRKRPRDQFLLVRISGEDGPDLVRYRVEDNGPGIPEAFRERMFNLFEKLMASDRGSGLGLAIARRIVESRGGSIRIETSILGGVSVVFDLPAGESGS